MDDKNAGFDKKKKTKQNKNVSFSSFSFSSVYDQKFQPRRWTLFILKWNTILITEIYRFLQYFELVTVDYKRIPAVSLYQTSDIRLCFLLFSKKVQLEKWLVVPRRSSVFTRSLDNGKIIITLCMCQKTTQNYGYKSRNLNCCYSYSSNRNTAPRHSPWLSWNKTWDLNNGFHLPEASIKNMWERGPSIWKKKDTIESDLLFSVRWLS